MDKTELIEWLENGIANDANILDNGNLESDSLLKTFLEGELNAFLTMAFNLTGDPLYIAKRERMMTGH